MFKKAERFLTNPTIALTGPTGSGKTMSGLLLASGIAKAMGKPFAVIDTENGSASLYADMFEFDTVNLSPPFTIDKYIKAISEAEKGGYCCLLIDSLTHAWAGEGGLTAQKDQLDARPGTNHWTNWGPIKKQDLALRNAYLHSSIPFMIATMRSKMEYAQSESGGKKKIEKKGLAPIQSPDVEYEFSLQFDIAINHEAEVSKDRTNLFANKNLLTITEDVGTQLVAWRNSGKVTPAPQAPQPSRPVAPAVQQRVTAPIARRIVPDQQHPIQDDSPFPEEEMNQIKQEIEESSDHGPYNEIWKNHISKEEWEALKIYKVNFGKNAGKVFLSLTPNQIEATVKFFNETLGGGKKLRPEWEDFMWHADIWKRWRSARGLKTTPGLS